MTSKNEILDRVRRNEITSLQAMQMIREMELQAPPPAPEPEPEIVLVWEKPTPTIGHPEFRVARSSRWCSIYFHGLRRPINIPAALCHELLSNIDRFRQFIEENREKFSYPPKNGRKSV
jgi:hypothetical protein